MKKVIISKITRKQLYKMEYKSKTEVSEIKYQSEGNEDAYRINSFVEVLCLMIKEEYLEYN